MSDMRLAGICENCRRRLGVDERLTFPLQFIHVAQLPEYNPKSMAGIQFPGASQAFGGVGGQKGTTKITYKIAKTVKESIDDAASHEGQSSMSHQGVSKQSSSKR